MNAKERKALLGQLQERFEQHSERHPRVLWATVEKHLEKNLPTLKSVHQMEATGGEPDVIDFGAAHGGVVFCDCSAESPTGRRSLCYDKAGRVSRREAQPVSSVQEIAEDMGIEVLTEDVYRRLQEFGEFDMKTSSWILTPPDIRSLGGALFCDRRYGKVFVYHNGAQSYYAARGFRGLVRL